jgi:hypothetical protein
MHRVCVTRRRKVLRAAAAGRTAALAGPAVAGPLFQGAVFLADVEFRTKSAPVRIDPSDLAVVEQYLQRVVAPIADYAGQYGPCRLTSGGVLPTFTTPVLSKGYTDADLQGLIDAIVQANSLDASASVLVLNPIGVENLDAKEHGGVGVLGYHGHASRPYSFVNALGSGFALDDRQDLFAEAVSHEIAEMTVDPLANESNPEVCDGCGTNCQGSTAYRAYFDASGRYLQSANKFPPAFDFAFFLSAVAQPAAAADCPAPAAACAYPPPGGA